MDARMSTLESHREAAVDYRFPRQTLISILLFCVAWEVLSQLSPYLGIPPFAVPSFVRQDAQSGVSCRSANPLVIKLSHA